VEAARTAGGWRLDGSVDSVVCGHAADLLLVPARAGGATRVFLVERGPGVDTRVVPGLDPTQSTTQVHLSSSPARHLEIRDDATSALAYAVAFASICLAADSLGGAQACLDMAVEYATMREQFGRPIGSFQSIKHKLADVALAVRRAEGLVMYAALAGNEAETLELDAAVAKAEASEAYLLAGKENIQVHGGIGFTWELGAHLYFKRATTNDLTFGDVRAQRTKIAEALRGAVDIPDSPALTRR
jgi:alkylation response protein AidB-like acyl-CoA dehydrogenase